ncbi:RNA methyltransferase [Paenibacillus sp. GSMTC-2017]|uniref:TRM11 family SAM-dependent methyltransferase n=1 Tax=Paenibacillus sp. GSMTC-2017 TaxID=2794350 RepID=UPI0018DA2C21|nr:RNA methyltransferase [Paenibacillus sp. GSMTC-2017]MBH5320003.1 RNA methyltransferase [Paenibacillus sp. GSMTC-2017]
MKYMYTYARHEDEAQLCDLELRCLFGKHATRYNGVVACEMEQPVHIDRSPFFKRRLEVTLEASTLSELEALLPAYDLEGETFKVFYTAGNETFTYEEQRQLERTVGASLIGHADMRTPSRRLGLMRFDGQWLFGPCEDNEALWLKHQRKPQNYSTALPTRAARAIVNIAAGSDPTGKSMIDPCCGMGTVLIEALSMNIAIEGMDINPLAARGARINLSHYGYPNVVQLGDMRLISRRYDSAIVDLPYNLCSVLERDEQLEMLQSIRKIADRAVIVTTEPILQQLQMTSFELVDCAELSKASFTRYISVVE